MHDGQVLMEGTPKEVVANEDVRRVYLGPQFSM
jgi:lipopolysaccharide export system ATP-binding protein